MLFTSFPFLIFITFFFSIYFYLGKKNKIIFLILSSFFFYGWWDYRFLFLLIFSILFDFYIGKLINDEKIKRKKKIYFISSIFLNLLILSIFKYLNFFLDGFYLILKKLNITNINENLFNIILPIGISFYTFQKLSYIFDLYKNKCKVERNLLNFTCYVSLFPQLIAGPIVRAKKLLPQINSNIKPLFIDGLRLILWGFFLKLCLADTLAIFVDACFENPNKFGSMSLLIGSIFFSFQIYGDFAGYSLIAIGLGKLMGFNFGINFNAPYFANSFRDFWKRWHISLSSWFRDYIYINLGGNKKNLLTRNRNVMFTMVLAGLWHGANITFVIWGFLHAILIIIQNTFQKYLNIKTKNKIFKIFQIIFIFSIINILWIFFRSKDINSAFFYIKKIFNSGISFEGLQTYIFFIYKGFFLIFITMIIDYFITFKKLNKNFLNNKLFNYFLFLIVLLSISIFGTFNEAPFIYFQF